VQPTIGERIAHIDAAIENIREGLAGQTKASFANSLMLRLAVERLLEIISVEAYSVGNEGYGTADQLAAAS
jgi:hypothetical protein